jgi:hypothetical protein
VESSCEFGIKPSGSIKCQETISSGAQLQIVSPWPNANRVTGCKWWNVFWNCKLYEE